MNNYTDTVAASDQILAATIEHEGGTFNYRGISQDITSGYVVASKVVDTAIVAPTSDAIATFIQYLPTYCDGSKPLIGTWIHEGRLYLDTVEVIGNKYAAILAGKERGEIAIWDAANACEITI